jgi:signal transduction histidine kinase
VRSLRFRIPALVLAGMALAGLISIAIAVRLFQDFAHDQAIAELKREADGIARLYTEQAEKGLEAGSASPAFAASKLELATSDRLFYVGPNPFPGAGDTGLRPLPEQTIDWSSGEELTFEFTPPGEDRRYLAVAHPVFQKSYPVGALVVAKPSTALRASWLQLSKRLAFAFLIGLFITGTLAWFLSRRVANPVLALSRATDEVAKGRYDVDVPDVKGGSEVSHLANRFREMTERLKEAEELERHFLMSVSHELRTPLTAIRGHVSALREGVIEDDELREYSLEVIQAETERLERLVGDVLDLAKLDARRFTLLVEEVDMERLVERAYATFAEEARRRSIDYRREIKAQAIVTSDGDRVLQIISNLLANAFRWTPDGGRIDLELDAANGTISVAVKDTGPGIGPAERERIFKPFWSRDHGGTGLGLAIARELSMALGGRIDLDSRPGRGSRFALLLPVDHQAAARPAPATSP